MKIKLLILFSFFIATCNTQGQYVDPIAADTLDFTSIVTDTGTFYQVTAKARPNGAYTVTKFDDILTKEQADNLLANWARTKLNQASMARRIADQIENTVKYVSRQLEEKVGKSVDSFFIEKRQSLVGDWIIEIDTVRERITIDSLGVLDVKSGGKGKITMSSESELTLKMNKISLEVILFEIKEDWQGRTADKKKVVMRRPRKTEIQQKSKQ